MSYRIGTYQDPDVLEAKLVDELCGRLQHAIRMRGHASLVVSGGRTPLGLFRRLSQADIDFSNLSVYLCDERWVDIDHPDSNARQVKTVFMQGAAAQVEFLPMYAEGVEAELHARRLNTFFGDLPKFDVVVLGMGMDGHTASLFPGAQGVAQALDPNNQCAVVAVTPLDAPHERLTLTASRLLNTRVLYLQISGKDKNDLLQNILSTPGNTLPIATFLHQTQVRLDIFTTVG